MKPWLRIALIVGLVILLWILVVDFAKDFSGSSGSIGPSVPVGSIASGWGPASGSPGA